MKKMISLAMTLLVILSTFSILASQGKATCLPVGYWKFDEGSGTVASDSSGNGNTGTLMNGPQWVEGKFGKALKFDGVNDHVSIPHSASLDITGTQIQVEYWMRLSADWYAEPEKGVEFNQILYDKGDAYVCSMTKSNGRLRFNLPYCPPYPETNKNSWDADTWYHIVNVFDNGQIRIYVDDILDKAENVTSSSVPHSTINLAIGSQCYGGKNHFNGTIDDFTIYDCVPPLVGGVYVPVSKFGLLAPYIGLTMLLAVAVATAVYVKKRKRDIAISS